MNLFTFDCSLFKLLTQLVITKLIKFLFIHIFPLSILVFNNFIQNYNNIFSYNLLESGKTKSHSL